MGSTQPAAPWSRWLRRYRDQQDLTQEELGRVLGVEGKTVSAWENGQRPGRRHARNLCAALGTTRAELGLVEAVMERRTFLRHSVGLGAMAVLGPWAGIDRIDHAASDAFEATNEVLWQLSSRAGAAAALGPALGHVESISRLLEGALPGSLRPRLYRLLAEGAALGGALKSWMGDAPGAAHFAGMAEDAAAEAGDADLAVFVRVVRTASDRRLAAAPEARLRAYAADGAQPATRVRALAKAADAHAALGRGPEALRALDEAESALAGIGAGAGRVPRVDERWLAGERGATLARLGRTAEARDALDAALRAGVEIPAVDRLWLRLASARTHVVEGDHEMAAALALRVLGDARGLHHGQVEDEVGRLRAALRSAGPSIQALDHGLALD